MNIAIYKIENSVNGKRYFGQAVNPNRRWGEHKSEAKRNKRSYKLYRAVQKYGVENFSFHVLHWCSSKEDADELEQFVIDVCNSRVNGYNITPGGDGLGAGVDHPLYGKTRDPEVVAKISEQQKGRTLAPEWRLAISNSLKGKPKSEEHIANCQKKRKGEKRGPLSEAHRQKLKLAKIGTKPSEKCIAAATAAKLGTKRSPETIEKMRLAAVGRAKSPEERAKISASMKALRARQRGE